MTGSLLAHPLTSLFPPSSDLCEVGNLVASLAPSPFHTCLFIPTHLFTLTPHPTHAHTHTSRFTELCEGGNLMTSVPFHTHTSRYTYIHIYMYIYTELCEGGNLMTSLASSRFYCERDVANIMRQLCDAVRHCHLQVCV